MSVAHPCATMLSSRTSETVDHPEAGPAPRVTALERSNADARRQRTDHGPGAMRLQAQCASKR
jgi:hypothetical protein